MNTQKSAAHKSVKTKEVAENERRLFHRSGEKEKKLLLLLLRDKEDGLENSIGRQTMRGDWSCPMFD